MSIGKFDNVPELELELGNGGFIVAQGYQELTPVGRWDSGKSALGILDVFRMIGSMA